MFIIASIIFLLAGIWRGSVIFTQMYKRPKVDAEIVSTEMKTGYPPFKNKEHAFARIKYQFNEHSFDNEEIALKTKSLKVGDIVQCYVDPKNPKDIEEFAPKKDAIPVIMVIGIGIILMVIHFAAMDALSD